MKEYYFDILTRMFISGSNPQIAELRTSELRGSLRWWFRALGGARDSEKTVREQEKDLFGGIGKNKDDGRASKLVVRIKSVNAIASQAKDAEELGSGQNTPLGYFLFPLRSNKIKNIYAGRAFYDQWVTGAPSFVVWTDLRYCKNVAEKEQCGKLVDALMTVFGHLGGLGFRSRRCMGALAFHDDKAPMSLDEALSCFRNASELQVKSFGTSTTSADSCMKNLANWYKGWRSYGPKNGRNTSGKGFDFATRDHDIGLGIDDRPAVRPALGLPIIQRYSSGGRESNNWGLGSKNGRFASPVLLRPHRRQDGKFDSLVIFVDTMKWSERDQVTINDRLCPVSTELYEAMKEDSDLKNLI